MLIHIPSVDLRAFEGLGVSSQLRWLTHTGSSCAALRAKTKQYSPSGIFDFFPNFAVSQSDCWIH
jgi:hypothetical protein